jgi:NADH-quinone oxidoreductase subunit F
VYEFPFGITLRELLAAAGGVRDGRELQAVLLGGAAGTFAGPHDLDLPMSIEGARAAGLTLGSGVVMVFDGTVDLRDVLARVAAFFRDESCGQCVPCRVGTVRQEELVHRLCHGAGRDPGRDELVLLRDVGRVMRDASICGLGQTASSAIESAIDRLGVFGATR